MLKGHTKMCSLSPNFMSLEEKKQISLPQKLTIQQQQHQQYALKWSDYQSSILNCFQRLRDEEDFVDVTLSCDQRNFSAHRIVLSACSPYFRKLLKTNPCKHPIVILRDVHSDNMECLLSFMYNGEVNVRHDQLPDFLKTAHLLQIRGLTDVSENYYSSGCISSEGKSIDTLSANETCKLDSNRDVFEIESGEKCNYFPKYKGSSEPPMVSNSSSTGVNSTAIEDTETSTTACLQWENSDVFRNRKHHLTPPPHKRIKSADLFRAQHGISSDRALSEKEFSSFVHHSLARDRKHVEGSELKFGLVKDEKPQSLNQHIDIESKHEESADEESNRSNDDNSDHDDKTHGMKDSIGQQGAAVHSILLGGPKHMEQHPVINLNDFEIPGEMPSNMIVKANANSKTQPMSTIWYNSFWNAKYEDVLDEEIGFTGRSGNQNNLSTDNFVAKSTALSLMVKTARLKNKSSYLGESMFTEEHQVKGKSENIRLPSQYKFHNCFEKQQPLHEYLFEIQKSAINHQQMLNANLMATTFTFDESENTKEMTLTTPADSGVHSFTYRNNNKYWLPCPLCEAPLEQKLFRQHLDDHYPRDSPVCPVVECGRRFAHPNSVRNHMRIKHTQQWAKMKVMRSSAGPLPNRLDVKTKCMGISQDRTSTATIQAAKMVQLNAIGKGFENLPSTMMHSKYNLSTESITKEAFVGNLSEEPNLSPEPILRHQLSCGVSLSENIQTLSSSTATADMEHSFNDPKRDECESMQTAQMSASKLHSS